MLHLHTTVGELEKAFVELLPYTRIQPIISSIKIHQQKLMPHIGMRLYSYDCEDGKYWICMKINPLDRYQIFLGYVGENFEVSTFEIGFRKFLEQCSVAQKMVAHGYILTWGREEMVKEADRALLARGYRFRGGGPAWLFADMKAEQPPVIELPEGYSLDHFRDEDAPIIAACWKYGAPNEEELIRIRLRVLPTVCVRFEGKPVAFEFTEHQGMMMHLYVLPEHRGKRLQKAVIAQLAHEIKTKLGLTPYWGVVQSNESMLRASEKSHILYDHDGERVAPWFFEYEKNL